MCGEKNLLDIEHLSTGKQLVKQILRRHAFQQGLVASGERDRYSADGAVHSRARPGDSLRARCVHQFAGFGEGALAIDVALFRLAIMDLTRLFGKFLADVIRVFFDEFAITGDILAKLAAVLRRGFARAFRLRH